MSDLELWLKDAVAQSGVPGASVAVFADGQIEVAAAGVADVSSGAPVGTDTPFVVGSVTKPMTAAVLLDLIAEGRLSLDDPVIAHLPDLRMVDPVDEMTVAHLLDNTCGVPGLHIPDFDGGEDAIERYVASLASVRLTHRPGTRFAYSNGGFTLAGAILQRLEGSSWASVMRARLWEPLEMTGAVSIPPDSPRCPVAADHAHTDAGVHVVPRMVVPGMAPAGATLCATAVDLCRFGAATLHRWPSMHVARAAMPGPHYKGWGLGWAIYGWGASVAGWDGVGPGCRAFLRVIPERSAAVALLTNSSKGRRLYWGFLADLLRQRFNVEMAPERPPVTSTNVQIESGTYRCGGAEAVIKVEGGHITCAFMMTGGKAVPLLPAGGSAFVFDDPEFEYPVAELYADFASLFTFGWRRD